MEIEKVVEMLQEIKQLYPSLSNDEVLKIMDLKIKLENRARGI